MDAVRKLNDVLGGPVLWRSTPRTLAGQDLAVFQKVATPNTARLVTVQGALQARLCHGARDADALGLVYVGDVVREEQTGGGTGRLAATGRAPSWRWRTGERVQKFLGRRRWSIGLARSVVGAVDIFGCSKHGKMLLGDLEEKAVVGVLLRLRPDRRSIDPGVVREVAAAGSSWTPAAC